MMGEMKSFSVSPGWSVFIKASPMRKPRKPAARRLRIVSGCEMPLSETSMGILRTSEAPFFDPKNEEALAEFSGADPEAIKNFAKEGTDKLRDTFDKKPAEFKPQEKPEQTEQPTSVEELEQQVLKQNELGKSVDTEETKQDDKK